MTRDEIHTELSEIAQMIDTIHAIGDRAKAGKYDDASLMAGLALRAGEQIANVLNEVLEEPKQ